MGTRGTDWSLSSLPDLYASKRHNHTLTPQDLLSVKYYACCSRTRTTFVHLVPGPRKDALARIATRTPSCPL